MTDKNKTIVENLEQINDFLRLIGFDNQKIAEHHQRLQKLILTSIVNDLDKVTALKDKEPFPKELKSIDDIFNYYAQYIDKEIVDKIIQEKYFKFYSEYIGAMDKPLKEIDSL